MYALACECVCVHVVCVISWILTPSHVVAFLTKMPVYVSLYRMKYLRIQYLDPISEGKNVQINYIIYGYDMATVKITWYFDSCFIFALTESTIRN